MWLSLILKYWRYLAVIVSVLALWALVARREHIADHTGYQRAKTEDQAQLNAYKAEAEKRITQGNRQHEIDIAQLAAIRSEPHPSVVCHRASPQVRPAPRVPEPEAAGDRTLPARADESADATEFDPTAALYAIADEADEKNAACRMLNMAVHGMPSAP